MKPVKLSAIITSCLFGVIDLFIIIVSINENNFSPSSIGFLIGLTLTPILLWIVVFKENNENSSMESTNEKNQMKKTFTQSHINVPNIFDPEIKLMQAAIIDLEKDINDSNEMSLKLKVYFEQKLFDIEKYENEVNKCNLKRTTASKKINDINNRIVAIGFLQDKFLLLEKLYKAGLYTMEEKKQKREELISEQLTK